MQSQCCNVAASNRSSGQSVTPAGATEIMDIIGKDESIARIRAAD